MKKREKELVKKKWSSQLFNLDDLTALSYDKKNDVSVLYKKCVSCFSSQQYLVGFLIIQKIK